MNQASQLLEYDFDDITTEEITTIKAVDIVIPKSKLKKNEKSVLLVRYQKWYIRNRIIKTQ